MSLGGLTLVTVIVTGALLISLSLYFRYKRRELVHRERIAALEKGVDPALFSHTLGPEDAWTPRIYLLRGMIWLFTGISLTAFAVGLSESMRYRENPEDRLERIAHLRNLGVPEEQLKELAASKEFRSYQKIPEGWAFLGLVPMGVGLAYLIFHVTEGRKLKQTGFR
jgi:hypothetical protein